MINKQDLVTQGGPPIYLHAHQHGVSHCHSRWGRLFTRAWGQSHIYFLDLLRKGQEGCTASRLAVSLAEMRHKEIFFRQDAKFDFLAAL